MNRLWWTGRDLNPLPLQCECSVLPDELPAHPTLKLRMASHQRNSKIKSQNACLPVGRQNHNLEFKTTILFVIPAKAEI